MNQTEVYFYAMPINKLALIRYRTIDECLRNCYRRWTLDDLVQACSDAVYEYEGIADGVSRRTVQLDLQTMRSEKLGYNAPIVVFEKKYYTYEDTDYSITNNPLTGQDLSTLTEVVEVLRQFSAFGYLRELTGMVNKLEQHVQQQRPGAGRSLIHFERNDLLRGLEHIDPLHRAIQQQHPIELTYQSFTAHQPNTFVFHPYLLKEYRNRWFVVGVRNKGTIQNLALDRIQSFTVLPNITLRTDIGVDLDTYFNDVIGVTKSAHLRPSQIVLRVHKTHLPYILTKPIHHSQKLLREEPEGALLGIKVVLNFELEREILGFGEFVEVLAPTRLRNSISQRVQASQALYSVTAEQ